MGGRAATIPATAIPGSSGASERNRRGDPESAGAAARPRSLPVTMRTIRRSLSLAPLLLALAALAACSSGGQPAWTYSPTASPSAGPSGAPGSAAPGSPAASGAGAPTEVPGGGAGGALQLTAQGVNFDKKDLVAPANTPFKLTFVNNDGGIPHNVAIHKDSPTGAEVFKGEIFSGVATKTYDVPALPAGTYGFVCSVHPTMTGTLTVK